jgi:thymidylate synthase (FAD)
MIGVGLRVLQPRVKLETPEWWFPAMAPLIEICGRKSHKSEERIGEKPAEEFVRRIAFKKGHESIIEHVSVTMTFLCSRTMSHQLVRHRLAAYTQESQRFVDYSKSKFDNVMNVILPPSIGEVPDGTLVFFSGEKMRFEVFRNNRWTDPQEKINPYSIGFRVPGYEEGIIEGGVKGEYEKILFFHSLLTAYDTYLMLRERGIPSEDARFVLPNASKTEVATTYNLRQWRHVFQMRCSKHAQWEIRLLMQQALATLIELLPFAFEDLINLLPPELQEMNSARTNILTE